MERERERERGGGGKEGDILINKRLHVLTL